MKKTYPLGVFRGRNSVTLVGREKYSETYRLVVSHGHGENFTPDGTNPSVMLPLGRKESLAHISDVRLSDVLDERIMTYSVAHDGQMYVRVAVFDAEGDMDLWHVASLNHHLTGAGQVVPEYRHDGQYVLYYGERELRVAFSKNLVAWHAVPQVLAAPRAGAFDHTALKVIAVSQVPSGLLVLYETRTSRRDHTAVAIGAILCATGEPDRLLWRTETPLHEFTAKTSTAPRTLGAAVFDRTIDLYFSTDHEKLITVTLPNPYHRQGSGRNATGLHRFARNPILSPTFYEWESHAVFNPAAFTDGERVHLLYRAMGPDGISRLGYASSADGIHFDERLSYPVFTPIKGMGIPTKPAADGRRGYDPEINVSGGGWAGCEDPRAVVIDDNVYMSYVAFDGWSFVRQALTSIPLEQVQKHHWKWRKPVLISKPGELQKNWVLFPEKIGGRYAILHGVSPKIHVEYIDSLEELDGKKYIESLPQAGGRGYHDPGRAHHWDNGMRGAGAPPLKTELGWLLLYHAIDQADPGRYKIGAMLLDLHDPTRVLYRTNEPILAPDEWYENDGKPGVVYTCGAVIAGPNLIVYYGGGDKRIAAARANVEHFLNALTAAATPQLEAVDLSLPENES